MGKVCSLLILTLQMTSNISGKSSMHGHKTAKIKRFHKHVRSRFSYVIKSIGHSHRAVLFNKSTQFDEWNEKENENCKHDEFSKLNGAAPNENHVLSVKVAD